MRIDESLFLGGLSKGDFLKSFGVDVFFDDSKYPVPLYEHVATGHVHGVAMKNRQRKKLALWKINLVPNLVVLEL